MLALPLGHNQAISGFPVRRSADNYHAPGPVKADSGSVTHRVRQLCHPRIQFGRIWKMSGQSWPKSCQIWPKSGEIWSKQARSGRVGASHVEVGTKVMCPGPHSLSGSGQILIEFDRFPGPTWAHSLVSRFGAFRANVVPCWSALPQPGADMAPISGQCRLVSAPLQPQISTRIRPKFGRLRPQLARFGQTSTFSPPLCRDAHPEEGGSDVCHNGPHVPTLGFRCRPPSRGQPERCGNVARHTSGRAPPWRTRQAPEIPPKGAQPLSNCSEAEDFARSRQRLAKDIPQSEIWQNVGQLR